MLALAPVRVVRPVTDVMVEPLVVSVVRNSEATPKIVEVLVALVTVLPFAFVVSPESVLVDIGTLMPPPVRPAAPLLLLALPLALALALAPLAEALADRAELALGVTLLPERAPAKDVNDVHHMCI